MSEQEKKTLAARLDVFTTEVGVDPRELEAALELVRRNREDPDASQNFLLRVFV